MSFDKRTVEKTIRSSPSLLTRQRRSFKDDVAHVDSLDISIRFFSPSLSPLLSPSLSPLLSPCMIFLIDCRLHTYDALSLLD